MEFIFSKFLVFAGFVVTSAFFSFSETTFTAINRLKLRSLIEDKEIPSDKLEYLLKNPKQLLTCILIGNNIANIAATTYATAFFIDLFRTLNFTNVTLVLSATTAIVTIILLIFGEITPKTLAMKNPAANATKLASIIYYIYLVLSPFSIAFVKISLIINKVFGIKTLNNSDQLTEEEIKLLIQLGQEDGIIHKHEQEMLHGVLNVFDKIVREIMTPRTDMLCVEIKSSVADVVHLITTQGHSRIPVYEDNIDSIIGLIYAKDLLNVDPNIKTHNLRSFMRDVVYIPETKKIDSLLQQMRQAKFHMAIVMDEYGGVSGVVTMEDIIEQIVGEIQDETDSENPSIRALSNTRYYVDASFGIDDLGKRLDFEFPEDDEYDTVAGFILFQLGAFPKKGESFKYRHLEFFIKEVGKRRILSVEIEVHPILGESEFL